MGKAKIGETTVQTIAQMETAGKSEDAIASSLGVSLVQLQIYVRENRVDIDYHKSRILGKQDEWLQALSKRAVGYDYKERKVTTTEQNGKKKVFTEISEKHLSPDTQALLWLIEHAK